MKGLRDKIWFRLRWRLNRLQERIHKSYYKNDYRNIPIIINSFNQLTYLEQLVTRLEEMGYNNIHIINNDSTYPPLLKYYSSTKHPVYNLGKNLGFEALWNSDIFKLFRNDYYVYTDADVVPIDECPNDILRRFLEIMQKYPKAQKVGLSLKIDDLPDCFKDKKKVIEWEHNWWIKPLESGMFDAQIDTTFALYRPYSSGKANFVELNIRTDFPYQARHLPWYSDSTNLTEEQKFYISKCKVITHWTEKMQKDE